MSASGSDDHTSRALPAPYSPSPGLWIELARAGATQDDLIGIASARDTREACEVFVDELRDERARAENGRNTWKAMSGLFLATLLLGIFGLHDAVWTAAEWFGGISLAVGTMASAIAARSYSLTSRWLTRRISRIRRLLLESGS
jgi:hypothetical protein